MPLPYVPPEIIDRIIALLWPDQTALRCCTTVCRQWLPASRYQLFVELNLKSRTAYDLLVSHILHSKALPSLTSTRRLILDESGIWRLDTRSERRAMMWAHRFFHDFAGYLPSLQELELRCVDWDLDILAPHPTTHLAFTRFDNVRRLILHQVYFPTFGFARRLLAALQTLDSLMVSETCALVEHPPGASLMMGTRRLRRPALTVLELVGPMDVRFVDHLVHFLFQTPTASTLRVLRLLSDRPRQLQDDPPSTSVLECLGSRVETLALRTEHASDGVSLSRLERVRSLSITTRSRHHWVDDVTRIVLGIPSRLFHLEIIITEGGVLDSGAGLRALDALLERSVFSDLRAVAIVFRAWTMHPPFPKRVHLPKIVQTHMPMTCARGLVRSICAPRAEQRPYHPSGWESVPSLPPIDESPSRSSQ